MPNVVSLVDEVVSKFDCHVISVDGKPTLECRSYDVLFAIKEWLNQRGKKLADVFYTSRVI